MPGYGAFDGYTYDDDTFDTDIFEAVTPPASSWTGKPVPSNTWTPKAAPTNTWTSEDDDGF